MKRIAVCLGVLGHAALPAMAGDASTLNILGFSKDGAVFAFEETGVQDGSGFPYANRFYIATATDAYLQGTPLRIRIEDETASVGDARAKAKADGEQATGISDAELAADQGELLAFNPLTEISADPFRLEFHDLAVYQSIKPPRILELIVTEEPAAENCHGMSEKQARFTLTLRKNDLTKIAPLVLHDDQRVPASRNCPTGYRLGGVVRGEGPDGPTLVTLILVQSIGFEGPDHRWIAVVKPDPHS
jgi:predicted secreted protein